MIRSQTPSASSCQLLPEISDPVGQPHDDQDDEADGDGDLRPDDDLRDDPGDDPLEQLQRHPDHSDGKQDLQERLCVHQCAG